MQRTNPSRAREFIARVPIVLAMALAAASAQRTVDSTIKQHLTFTCGKATVAAAGDYAMKATIATGAQHLRVHTFVRRRPFAYRQEVYGVDPAPLVVRITDGRHAWTVLPDGQHRLLANVDARITLEMAFVDGLLLLEPGALGGRAGLGPVHRLPLPAGLPPEVRGGFEVVPLACHAPGGSCLTFHFDPDDGRMHGLADAEVTPQRFVRFADWRQFGPLRLPALRFEGHVGEAATRIVVDDVRFGPLDAQLFAGNPVPPLGPDADAGPLEVAAHPVPGSCHFVVPRVLIAGRVEAAALFDTGAENTYLATALADDMRLPVLTPIRTRATAGPASGTRRWLDCLELPGVPFYQFAVGAVELPMFAQLERQPGLILGGEIWAGTAPVLDVRRGRLRLRGRSPQPLAGETVFTVPLTQAHERDSPAVSVSLGGGTVPAVVDSGNHTALRLTAAGLRRAKMPTDPATWIAAGAMPARTVGAGLAGTDDLLVQIESFRLGRVTFERPWVLLALGDGGGPPYEAVLGGGALSSFARVGFDLGRQRLELEPGADMIADGADWRVPAYGRFLGLLAVTPPRGPAGDAPLPVVIEVTARSPAAERGIVVDDRLVAIDGAPCAGVAPHRWNRKLWVREGRVVLDVRKADGRDVRVELP